MSKHSPEIEECIIELQIVPFTEIQRKTAWKWANRAIAADLLGSDSTSEYRGEALEHAALVEEDGFVDELRKYIDEYDY